MKKSKVLAKKVYCSQCKWFSEKGQKCNAKIVINTWYSPRDKVSINPRGHNWRNGCKYYGQLSLQKN